MPARCIFIQETAPFDSRAVQGHCPLRCLALQEPHLCMAKSETSEFSMITDAAALRPTHTMDAATQRSLRDYEAPGVVAVLQDLQSMRAGLCVCRDFPGGCGVQ